MNSVFQLSKRNIKLYLRDKTSVFFSFLSIIILLAIYLLFMANMIPTNPALTSAENARFVLGYIMGGVLVIATLTLPLGVIGSYVSDVESKRFNYFLVMPIKRRTITLSYFLSTFIVAFVLIMFMFLLTTIYIGATTGLWFSLAEMLLGLLLIAACLFVSVPLILFLISFVKTNNSFAGLSSLLGTLIGFISGIYIPLTVLGSVTKNIAALLPFSHMTILLRRFLVGDSILSKMPQEAIEGASMGYLPIFGFNVPIILLFVGFAVFSGLLLVLSYLRINKKRAS